MNERPHAPLAVPTPDILARFAGIVGAPHALTDPRAQEPYLREPRNLYTGRAAMILRPGTTEEVARILALANDARIGVVPQAGNTGLVGGQIPAESGTEIVLSVARLRRLRSVAAAATAMTVEAGLTLSEIHAAAEKHGRCFPLHMASQGSAMIGGALATNAGGVAVLAHGTARNLVMGLEVVLADGRIWDGLRALKKDNTGYDLRDLFIGSEGTLGIITAATLKLIPGPRETATAFVALPAARCLLPFFTLAEERAGPALTAFEFLSERTIAFVLRHTPGTRLPFASLYPWSVLLDISGTAEGVATALLERLLAEASGLGLLADAAVAGSLTQARDLWRLREAASEAQKPEGGSIKHDISVPVPAIPEFLARAPDVVERICPGARPVAFGHFGDGNVHFNVSQPEDMERRRFLALWEPLTHAVHALATELGGSISAEHGIGRLKRDELSRVKSAVDLDLMRRIKSALDPNGILNPGKVL
jgi:FAD/FMN-containing dehydrogenase